MDGQGNTDYGRIKGLELISPSLSLTIHFVLHDLQIGHKIPFRPFDGHIFGQISTTKKHEAKDVVANGNSVSILYNLLKHHGKFNDKKKKEKEKTTIQLSPAVSYNRQLITNCNMFTTK